MLHKSGGLTVNQISTLTQNALKEFNSFGSNSAIGITPADFANQ